MAPVPLVMAKPVVVVVRSLVVKLSGIGDVFNWPDAFAITILLPTPVSVFKVVAPVTFSVLPKVLAPAMFKAPVPVVAKLPVVLITMLGFKSPPTIVPFKISVVVTVPEPI